MKLCVKEGIREHGNEIIDKDSYKKYMHGDIRWWEKYRKVFVKNQPVNTARKVSKKKVGSKSKWLPFP